MKPIILASASPRRKELLTQIGIPFTVEVSDAEEVITKTEPALVVEELSALKAEAVFQKRLQAQDDFDGIVIGADTVVACDGKILGKPKSREDAANMLSMLQGKTHQVYTGVTFIGKDIKCSFHEGTEVTFFPMQDEEIATYVATGDCDDKAGAYGIQGFCARYIQGICGDYNTVVGLPIGRLYQELRKLNLFE